MALACVGVDGKEGGAVCMEVVEEDGCVPVVRWLVSNGNIAAIRSAVASELEDGAGVGQGPVRPRGLPLESRPSRTPSKSGVLGGSCFVASPAAFKKKTINDGVSGTYMNTHNCRCPSFEFTVVESEMLTISTDKAISVLAMFTLMLLTSPFRLEMNYVWSMQLGRIREGIKAGNLQKL